jgi:uncharacterized lipoprotein NlpE involved in copper resistance
MKLISIIFLIALIVSCNSNKNGIASTDSSYKTVVPETALIDAENYVGTLPCADCEGIDVSLQLNKDSSFVMDSFYKGTRGDSADNHLKEIGSWSLHGADTLYLINTNSHLTKYIKTDSTLTQLNGDGKIITGNVASMFILRKK